MSVYYEIVLGQNEPNQIEILKNEISVEKVDEQILKAVHEYFPFSSLENEFRTPYWAI